LPQLVLWVWEIIQLSEKLKGTNMPKLEEGYINKGTKKIDIKGGLLDIGQTSFYGNKGK
jgi:hypothetical protein